MSSAPEKVRNEKAWRLTQASLGPLPGRFLSMRAEGSEKAGKGEGRAGFAPRQYLPTITPGFLLLNCSLARSGV